MSERVNLGVGVIIEKGDGRILVGRRIGSHAQGCWSFPGGKVDPGETITEAAEREILQESGLIIGKLAVIGFTNNLDTWESEGVHHVSAVVVASEFSGDPVIMEPNRCEEWLWCYPNEVPEPQFEAHVTGVELYMSDGTVPLSPNTYRVQ